MVCALVAVSFLTAASALVPTSMTVDFDETDTEMNLAPGESGVMNLVIENTGGQSAENVEVRVRSGGKIALLKEFDLGTVVSGESKTIAVLMRAVNTAQPGLATVQVYINYGGYDSSGDYDKDETSYWEIPIIISEDPMFQITPEETTYFEGAIGKLSLKGRTMSEVNKLEATLSSSCLIVIGSSKKYVGNLDSDEDFAIDYDIKPSSSGACQTSLILNYKDAFGNNVSESVPIGLNIEGEGVDFKVIGVEYGVAGPGDTLAIKVTLKNEGKVTSEDTTLSLTLEDPFVPVNGIEEYAGDIDSGNTTQVEFKTYVSWDAETTTYSIPLNIDYKIGGTTYTEEKDIGVDITGRVTLEIISVEAQSGSVRVQVANIGTRTADSVLATLSPSRTGGMQNRSRGSWAGSGEIPDFSEGMPQQSGMEAVEYKSSIKATKESTFTFDTSYTGQATITFEYNGVNNERVTQKKEITIGSGTTSMASMQTAMRARRGRGINLFDTLVQVAIVVIVLYAGYRYYKKKKGKKESPFDKKVDAMLEKAKKKIKSLKKK